MTYRIALLLTFAIATSLVGSARADILVLKDGTRIEGDVKRHPEGGWQVTTPAGTQLIPSDQVASMEITGSQTARPDVARSRLLSLRRSVDALEDIDAILDRYRAFIAQYKTDAPDVVAEAQQDLATWQQRKDQNLVKYAGQWVTPEQRAQVQAGAIDLAGESRQLLAEGRLQEADALLARATLANPTHPTINYLAGVLHLRQDKLPQARKHFEAVKAAVPNHAPTLNNLALILFRQNQHVAAMNYYNEAMQSAPGDERILNNVAEALHALPDSARRATLVEKTARRFAEQDALLQQQKAREGLYRWGGNWVPKDQLEQVQRAEAEIKQRLDAMAEDFESIKDRIAQIDRDIAANKRAMRQIEATRYVRDTAGNVITLPMPAEYYEMQRDNARLESEQQSLARKLETLRDRAKQAQQRAPTPAYTGLQHPFPPEAAPVIAPIAAPATAPTDSPATQPTPEPQP